MSTYDINKIQLPNGDICNLRDANAKTIAEYKTLTDREIATFDNSIQNNILKSYNIKIEPKQDLHGYDKPWVGGSGKNLAVINLDDNNSYVLNAVTFTNAKVDGNIIGINGNGTPNFSNNFFVNSISVTSGTEYKLCNYTETGTTTTYWVRFVFRDSNGTAINVNGSPFIDINALSSRTITAPSNAVWLGYYINFLNGVAINNVVFKFAIYVSSSAPTSFEPYSNICPIEGWDEVEVMKVGKNLLADSGYVQGVLDWNSSNADGITNNIHFISSPYIKISANTQYTISSLVGNIVRIYVTDENHNTLYFLGNYPTPGTNRIIPATAGAYYIRITIGIDGQTITPSDYGTKVYGQLEAGSAATAYEPYSGTTYSITFPTEAGTVYGGTVTVNEDGSGTLIVDKAFKSFNGTEAWNVHGSIASLFYIDNVFPGISGDKETYYSGISNQYTWTSQIPPENNYYTLYSTSETVIRLLVKDSRYTTVEAFKDALGVSNLQIVYNLTSPIAYTFTASQLTILLGTNHIWTDAGNITITYPINLKGYIDTINNGCIKKSQQAQAVFYGLATSAGDNTQKSSSNAIGIYTDEAKGYILHMLGLDAIIGNYELDEYADKNYSVDQLFMMKGKLYKATSFIPQGGSIVPNTNCVQTTILENLINQSE